jgi:hypothetical protein
MSGSTTCPGCGLQLPASGLPWDRRRNASPECWQLYGEVQGFELRHLELVRDFHEPTVDAYAAQHAPREVATFRPSRSLTPWSGCTWHWTTACPVSRLVPRTSGWASPTHPGRACLPGAHRRDDGVRGRRGRRHDWLGGRARRGGAGVGHRRLAGLGRPARQGRRARRPPLSVKANHRGGLDHLHRPRNVPGEALV